MQASGPCRVLDAQRPMNTVILETTHRHSSAAMRAVWLLAWLALGAACGSEDHTARDASMGCGPMPCPSQMLWDQQDCACVPTTMSERCDLNTVLQQRLEGSEAI